MWEFGVITLREKRAESCRYNTITGIFRLHSDCIEANGITNTKLKVETIIPISVIQKIEFN